MSSSLWRPNLKRLADAVLTDGRLLPSKEEPAASAKRTAIPKNFRYNLERLMSPVKSRIDSMIRRSWFIIVVFISAACVTTQLVAADWPTFGHDPQRSGWASEEKSIT